MENKPPRMEMNSARATSFLDEVDSIIATYCSLYLTQMREPHSIYHDHLDRRIKTALEYEIEGFREEVEAKKSLKLIEMLINMRKSGGPHICASGNILETLHAMFDLPDFPETTPKPAPAAADNPENPKPATGGTVKVTVGMDFAKPGSDQTVVQQWVPLEEYQRRERELLKANTEAVERYRKAEASVRELEKSASVSMPALMRAIDQRVAQAMRLATMTVRR